MVKETDVVETGNMMLPLASSTWNEEDVSAAVEVIHSGKTTMGLKVIQFEDEFARFHGSKNAIMVNSGSSANLIGMSALHWAGRLKGSEIIVPAVSWATTFYPVNQLGYKLVFVDIDAETLNISPAAVEAAINEKTAAILSVNLLGNPADYEKLKHLSVKYDKILIEDNCESLGATWNTQLTGTIGLLGTFSFFFSHHINTMEGGMILTDDDVLADFIRSIRAHGWIRDIRNIANITNKRIDLAQAKFSFVLPGYNVRPTEVQASFGLTQLRKLPEFIRNRQQNAKYLKGLIAHCPEFKFRIQQEVFNSSWFGFAIVAENETQRKKAIIRLEEKGIETRPIVTGNFVNQPVIDLLDYRVEGDLVNAQKIHECGFFIGNHHYPIHEALNEVVNILSKVN